MMKMLVVVTRIVTIGEGGDDNDSLCIRQNNIN